MPDRIRRWAITINFENMVQYPAIRELFVSHERQYHRACHQIERAPTTGHLHVQGYLEFKNPFGMQGVKDMFIPHQPHVEPARRSAAKNHAYCTDQAKRALNAPEPYVFGDFSITQGQRSDLAEAVDTMRTGTLLELWDKHAKSMVIYHRGLMMGQQHFSSLRVKRDWYTTITWIYGPTGVGKTRSAIRLYDGQPCFHPPMPNNGIIYYDSYKDEPWMHVDDYGGQYKYEYLVGTLINNVPVTVPCRGYEKQFLVKHLVITSERHPRSYYPDRDISSLERRFRDPGNALIHMIVPIPEVVAYRAAQQPPPINPPIINQAQPLQPLADDEFIELLFAPPRAPSSDS